MEDFDKYGELQILLLEEHRKKLGIFKSEVINRKDVSTIFKYVRQKK